MIWRRNVEALSFDFSDIQRSAMGIWTNRDASARLRRLTAAQARRCPNSPEPKLDRMEADVPSVESGGKADCPKVADYALGFEPGLVDRILRD